MGLWHWLFGSGHAKEHGFSSPMNRLALADSLVTSGEVDRAIAVLSEGLAGDPYSVDMLTRRAGAYHKARRYDEAIVDYTRAIELCPSGPELAMLYYYRGNAHHILSDRSDLALADIDRSLSIDPSNTRARENREFIARYLAKRVVQSTAGDVRDPLGNRDSSPLNAACVELFQELRRLARQNAGGSDTFGVGGLRVTKIGLDIRKHGGTDSLKLILDAFEKEFGAGAARVLEARWERFYSSQG